MVSRGARGARRADRADGARRVSLACPSRRPSRRSRRGRIARRCSGSRIRGARDLGRHRARPVDARHLDGRAAPPSRAARLRLPPLLLSVGRRLVGDCAAALAAYLDGVRGDTVHLVGHSLGGVLICAMLESRLPARLGRVVCLGSPLRGSRTAARLARWPGGPRLIGRCLADVHARGGFDAWRAGVEVGSIAGRIPLGVGRLLGPFREPNDGTVAVAETVIAGLADHVVLPVSHVALLWSAQVAAQMAHFLEHGRFRHGAAAEAGRVECDSQRASRLSVAIGLSARIGDLARRRLPARIITSPNRLRAVRAEARKLRRDSWMAQRSARRLVRSADGLPQRVRVTSPKVATGWPNDGEQHEARHHRIRRRFDEQRGTR